MHAPPYPSGYADSFARDKLPPREQWPEMIFELPQLRYPDRLNCAAAFVDAHVAGGRSDNIALFGENGQLTYSELLACANRIARVLTEDLKLPSGSRVLLRSGNNPTLAASWLGVLKAGCIAVTTMPLLRERELSAIVRKAKIAAAICDHRIGAEMELTRNACPELRNVLYFHAPPEYPDSLERRTAEKPATFTNIDSAADDAAADARRTGDVAEAVRPRFIALDDAVVAAVLAAPTVRYARAVRAGESSFHGVGVGVGVGVSDDRAVVPWRQGRLRVHARVGAKIEGADDVDAASRDDARGD